MSSFENGEFHFFFFQNSMVEGGDFNCVLEPDKVQLEDINVDDRESRGKLDSSPERDISEPRETKAPEITVEAATRRQNIMRTKIITWCSATMAVVLSLAGLFAAFTVFNCYHFFPLTQKKESSASLLAYAFIHGLTIISAFVVLWRFKGDPFKVTFCRDTNGIVILFRFKRNN